MGQMWAGQRVAAGYEGASRHDHYPAGSFTTRLSNHSLTYTFPAAAMRGLDRYRNTAKTLGFEDHIAWVDAMP